METPSWFFSDSSCNTVESQRAQQRLAERLAELQQMFPDLSERSIRAALGDGGDLNEVASRLLSGGAAAAPAPALAMMSRDPFPPASLGGATLSGSAPEGAISGAAADREVALATAREEMAAVGSARGALSPTGSRLVAAMQPYQASQVELGHMTLRQLGEGPLRLTARIARTVNELEENLIGGDKVVTQYVIEVTQLGFTWEVMRRYSQFATFNETLSFHWVDLPELPPKRFFSTECDDLAERMMQLERYLKVLTATPELALSPPVCTFLDAVDVAQFRTQMLPTAPPARQAFVPVTPSAPR